MEQPQGQLQLSRTELQLFLEGSEAVGRIALSPAPLQQAELRRFSSENGFKEDSFFSQKFLAVSASFVIPSAHVAPGPNH